MLGVSAQAADTLSIVMTGDILLDRGVRRVIEKRGVDHRYFESPGSHDDAFWAEYAVKMVELMFA